MRNTKTDRRSQRTRQLLSAALFELMLEKRYDGITVQDIIDRANVGRSTFYAHYLDKEDLLVSDFTRVLDALTQQMHQHGQGDQHAPPSLALSILASRLSRASARKRRRSASSCANAWMTVSEVRFS